MPGSLLDVSRQFAAWEFCLHRTGFRFDWVRILQEFIASAIRWPQPRCHNSALRRPHESRYITTATNLSPLVEAAASEKRFANVKTSLNSLNIDLTISFDSRYWNRRGSRLKPVRGCQLVPPSVRICLVEQHQSLLAQVSKAPDQLFVPR